MRHTGARPCSGRLGAITDADLIPTGYERTLPPAVQVTVRARRRSLSSAARGRVLDLGGADSHRRLWQGLDATVLDGSDDPALESLARTRARYDTVFSVFQLASATDLPAVLDRVKGLLAEDGSLLFLEPGRRPGITGRVQSLVSPAVGMVAGWRVDRDIPVALREAGLSVVDLDRPRLPTVQWWLRTAVEGRAHHARAPSRRGPTAPGGEVPPPSPA